MLLGNNIATVTFNLINYYVYIPRKPTSRCRLDINIELFDWRVHFVLWVLTTKNRLLLHEEIILLRVIMSHCTGLQESQIKTIVSFVEFIGQL